MLSKDRVGILLVRSHDLADSGDVGCGAAQRLVIAMTTTSYSVHTVVPGICKGFDMGQHVGTTWTTIMPQLDSLLSTKVVLLLKPTKTPTYSTSAP